MTTSLPRLPIDLQSFEIIREEGFLYVDKTRYIHEMLEGGRYYFMARPRRFGKTLMVSALKCFFTGRRELFEGLWIGEKNGWQWQSHPVIQLDFNAISHDTGDHLEKGLEHRMNQIAREYRVDLTAPLLKERFQELILSVNRQTGLPVVILIDEYDKPIIDHLGKGDAAMEIAKANRDILKFFLGTLKGGEVSAHIRFVFITGVSKFSRVSLFSDLNNLIDISMSDRYAAMLGYTQEEVAHHFDAHLSEMAKKLKMPLPRAADRLRAFYDGYRFSEDEIHVYNPFSLLRAFSNLKLKNYWFETGTPTFLINLLREKNYPLPTLERLDVGEQIFSVYELERLSLEALLFQTGYLTIKDVRGRIFTLGYPNQEVKLSFIESLMYAFSPPGGAERVSRFLLLSDCLKSGDLDAFFETVNGIFAAIPYTLAGEPNEAWFHTLFYLMVSASGADAQSEVLTSRGRIDLVVTFADTLWIMEFKCDQSAEAGLKQIREKGYADRYRGLQKKVRLMGIRFDSKTRAVTEWRVC